MYEEIYENMLKKVAKGAGIVFVGTGVGMFFAYLGMLIVARFLGPTDYGLISLASAVATIASTVILLGMPTGIVRYVSFYNGKDDKGKIKGTIVSALKVVLPLGIAAGIILFLFSDLISTKVFHDPNLIPILRIFSFSVPFYALFCIFDHAIGGFQEMKYVVYGRDLFQNGSRLFLLILLLLLGYGVYGAAFAYTFAIIGAAFVSLYYLSKVFPIFSKEIKSISMEKELFHFSWPLMFAGIFGLVMGWIDTLMLGYFLTATDVGIYRASLSTATLLMIVPGSFGTIFFPVITEIYSKGKMQELEDIDSTVTKWIFMLVFPLVALMILFSKHILNILYGSEYVIGAISLCILGLGYLLISTVYLTNQLIQTIGRTKLIMTNVGVGAVIDIILNSYLIPLYGINGAAIATALSLLAVNVLAFGEVYWITRIQPVKLNYAKIVFSSLISVILVYSITKSFFKIVPIYVLIAMFVAYIGIYFILILVSRTFEKDDVVIMKAIEKRTGIQSEWIRNVIGKFL